MPAADPVSLPLPAPLLEDFEVVRSLGAGGMGAVWLVRDRFLDRLIALKVLRDHDVTAELRERFLLEARTSARLEHPHIIDVYRADETEGTVWFTMRFVNGESLGDRLRSRGTMPASEVARVLREVAWALAYAHARGVVHRDIKPDNILLDRDSGRTVLTDFGIARDIRADARGLTQDGYVLGTVQYMSPEQAAGDRVDARSDVYALGVVGFHALTGRVPFDGAARAVLAAHVTQPAPRVRDVATDVLPVLADIVDRCLRKEPDERWPSADALANALEAALQEARLAEQAAADAAPGALVSEAEAQAIWQRAAQLQAAAAHRLEKVMALRPSADGSAAMDGDGRLRVRDVEAAAVDAGLSRQYVALALAERRGAGSDVDASPVSERLERQLTTLMGTSERAVSASRVIQAPASRVLGAIGTVLTTEPHALAFDGTVGGHPLDGGILRFRVPPSGAGLAWLPLVLRPAARRLRARLERVELFDLSVTLQPRETATRSACEVVVTGDLRAALRRNYAAEWGLIVIAAVLAGGLTAAAERAAGWKLSTGSLPAISVAGAAVIAGLGAALWYRRAFLRSLDRARAALDELLAAVDQHLAQQALFGGAPESRALTPTTGA
jgi:tRNA A-37 threonylcarbamoyl transferase component Bud32